MFKHIYICLMIVAGLFFISATATAQEFPIVIGSHTTFLGGAAFDGTNFLVCIQGDSITAQVVSTAGSLVGSRISFGLLGRSSNIRGVAFDGSNYLVVWNGNANACYGQFINTSGNLVGAPFIIAAGVTVSGKGGCIAFGDTTYMVVYKKNDNNYGQLVNKSGNLIGTPIQISSTPSNEDAICFDGTNYLVAWRSGRGGENIYIKGQLVSKSGVLVGSNFTIDDYASDNPVSIAFDGLRYLVAFHDRIYKGGYYLSARFVTKSGSVTTDGFTIRDTTKFPCVPLISFDGTNYLITWTDNFIKLSSVIMGRFFNTSGLPIDTAFTIFNSLGGKVPFYGVPTFGSNKFLVVATRVDTPNFTNGDVYGKFIQSSMTGINEYGINLTIKEFSLSQNYPNPFNPSTSISFKLSARSFVSLKIFDLLGREVSTIVSEELPAGNHSRQWNASNMPSGVYFYRLQAGSFTETKKLVLLR